MKFINIGFGNMVSANRIVAIAGPDSAPIKRLVQDAKEDNRVIRDEEDTDEEDGDT